MENRDLKMAEKIAACVADKGGRTFLVGGYVRDLLMGKHSKDIDIEIHGVQPKELENILDGLALELRWVQALACMVLEDTISTLPCRVRRRRQDEDIKILKYM